MVLENGIAWPLESVASIWMDTVTSGVVAASDTMGGGGSGFLLPITGGQVPSVDGGIATPLFSGYDLMADAGAAVSLHALMEAGSAGLVALNSGGYLLSRASSTANWTFGFTNLGTNHGSPVGTLTDEWWLGQDNAGLWIAFDNGGDLTTVTGTVNKTTTWDNVVWLDQQTESIPDGGVLCGYDSWSATGTYSPFIWVSADGSKMAFPDVQSAGFGGACISTNAGRDFVSIPMTQADAGGIMATGSDFLATGSGSAILVINPNPDPGTTPSPAAYLSTNGGATWLTATLSVATDGGNVAPDSASQLTAAFYASDGMHAWIVGNSGSGLPFLLTSANGGASFANLSPTLAEQYPTSTFTTGFALDQNNIWLGGTIDSSSQQVGLLYSPTGGQ